MQKASLMARPGVVAGMVILLSAVTPPVLAQDIEYRGGGYLSDPVNCEAHGWGQLTQFTARYLPIGRWGNEDPSLSMFFGDYAVNYRFPQDWEEGRFFEITEFGAVGDNVFSWRPDPPPRFRILVPGVVTTVFHDEELHRLFEVEHWNGLAGCTIRGEVWLRRRS